MMDDKKILTIASLIAVLLLFYVFFPFLDGIVIGLVLAYIGRPLKRWFMEKGLSPRTSSLITSLCIVVPVITILAFGIAEMIDALVYMLNNYSSFTLSTTGITVPHWLEVRFEGVLKSTLSLLISTLLKVSTLKYAWGIALLLINFLIAILSCYFLLKDGKSLFEAFMKILPPSKILNLYFKRLDNVLNGIFVGSLYSAILVAFLSLAVFTFFDVPYPLACTSLMFIASLVPLFSGVMVLVPIGVYKYLVAGTPDAILFLVVSSIVIYAPTELIARPYIVSVKTHVHPFLLLISFIGGGIAGGIAGFFLAPMLVGAINAAYLVYTEESDSS
jgi:predicted PurR-regulated permease PerM